MNNKAQFTPGPWFYNYDDYCIVNQAGVSVVNVHGAMGGNDTNADIAIIAAAPAMYEALLQTRKVIEAIDDYQVFEDLQNVLIAINKTLAQAEGKQS